MELTKIFWPGEAPSLVLAVVLSITSSETFYIFNNLLYSSTFGEHQEQNDEIRTSLVCRAWQWQDDLKGMQRDSAAHCLS